jgi:hypothetical protein
VNLQDSKSSKVLQAFSSRFFELFVFSTSASIRRPVLGHMTAESLGSTEKMRLLVEALHDVARSGDAEIGGSLDSGRTLIHRI